MATTPKKIYTHSDIKAIKEPFRRDKHETPSLIEDCLDIMIFLNQEKIVTYVSPSIAPVLGYTPEEVVGSHAYFLLHPEDVMTMQRMLGELGPGRSLQAEYRLRSKDGSWRWFAGNETNLLHVPNIGAIVGTFHDITAQKLAPPPHWSTTGHAEHFVQFYETDEFLIDALCDYIETGLRMGEACVVIATPAHRESLEARLVAKGLDLVAARAQNAYITLDAAETLALLLLDGLPDEACFVDAIAPVIERAAQGQRHVRAFGEMVELLWKAGKPSAAILLEELWNVLPGKTQPFSLFCAYAIQGFSNEAYGVQFGEICRQHSHVIPDESYSVLTSADERLRAITLLQQKARSLENEVAERRIAREQLRIGEERLRFITASMPQKIFTATPTGSIDYFNLQWEQYTGFPIEELQKEDWTSLAHPEDVAEQRRSWQQSIEACTPFYFEHRLRRADGAYLWHISRAIPIRDEAGNITMWIGSTTDIDEQKRLDERKNAFIGMASHELKTPVTSLKGFTQILQRRLKAQADPQTQLFLDRMDMQLKKLTTLIVDLLDISQMQAGSLTFRESCIDLDELLRETLETMQATITTHQLRLQGEAHVQVYGDRDRLGQVLINLLTNAVKYSPHSDTVIVHVNADHEWVEIAVQDFGIGIAREHHEHIFEHFYQVTDPQARTYPGLGIGLYIARTLVERHGGRLWLESKKGVGSTFHFSLPLFKGEEKQPARQGEEIV